MMTESEIKSMHTHTSHKKWQLQFRIKTLHAVQATKRNSQSWPRYLVDSPSFNPFPPLFSCRFINAICETEVMKEAHAFLRDKGKAPGSMSDFKKKLYEVWFKLYRRTRGDRSVLVSTGGTLVSRISWDQSIYFEILNTRVSKHGTKIKQLLFLNSIARWKQLPNVIQGHVTVESRPLTM